MPRSSILVPLLGVLLLGGCSSTVAGSPAPGADSRPTATDSTPSTDSDEDSDASSTRDLDPCELFTPETLAPLEGTYEAAEPQDLYGARGCKWSNIDAVTIAVVIWDANGIDDARGTPVRIGDREAKQSYEGAVCWVAIPVSESSRVDVLGLGDAEADSCAGARQAAEILVPDLPE
jgi:hypothetical protein